MIGWRLQAAKAGFFDRAKVIKAVNAAERRNLSRFGAFVRQAARTSQRTRKAASRPGQPPSAHTKDLRNRILFAYEQAPRPNVVIGPTLFNQSIRAARATGGMTVPEVLEEGGQIEISSSRRGEKRLVRIEARPYMGPANEREKAKLPATWANSVRG